MAARRLDCTATTRRYTTAAGCFHPLANHRLSLHGDGEILINLDYINTLEMPSLWRGEVQMIADAGHYSQWETPEAFNAVLIEFIDDVTME